MARGKLSMQAARVLQPEFSLQGFDILQAHGQPGVDSPLLLGKIRAWHGEACTPETILADLDMAVVSHEAAVSHEQARAYALIVVEETSSRPKLILGNVLATMLGKGIKFQGRRDLQVGRWTTLIVLARDKHQSQLNRLAYLEAQSKVLRENLLTPNASLGRVVIDTFVDDAQLEQKLRQSITEAIEKRGTW
jgi:hypothetical protein